MPPETMHAGPSSTTTTNHHTAPGTATRCHSEEMTMTATIECPAWVADLKALDSAKSTGIWDLHPASSAAALRFALDGDMNRVRVGDTLWLAGGGHVTVERVTKSLLHTTGGKFQRATGAKWQGSAWNRGYVVAIRTTTEQGA